MEKALRRKEKNKLRKRLGSMNVPEGRKVRRGRGPLAPISSVMFIDNIGGGELARRLQHRCKKGWNAGTMLPESI